jgi:N6-L-threonylcarbamoyladenine synthase
MLVLGIETSCDETGVGLVEDSRRMLANTVATQTDVHARFGGVVPELASRAHLDLLVPTVETALAQAGATWKDLDAIGVTLGPGLVGALLVGVAHAKALALAHELPLVGVNHLEAHVYANAIDHGDLPLPAIAFVVSGGHTSLMVMEGPGRYEPLGATLDDAAGEAYDKVARLLGLGYPGGPAIDRLAPSGNPEAVKFPRALMEDPDYPYDFSLSGLKTAVLRHVKAVQSRGESVAVADVAASFQEAVVDVQVTKALKACRDRELPRLLLAGGVAANTRLRERLTKAADRAGVEVLVPRISLCTDNGAMVACAASYRFAAGQVTRLDVAADPNLPLDAGASVTTA